MARPSGLDISRVARRLYRSGSLARRLMVVGRPLICPYDRLIQAVPEGTSVLDIGCGDGLFLNVLNELGRLSVGVGFDANRQAIANARTAQARVTKTRDVQFFDWSARDEWPLGEFDVVAMVDVLHHVPPLQRRKAIEDAMRRVKNGGLFLFKDIALVPAWRRYCNTVHDLVLTAEMVSYTAHTTVIDWATSAGASLRQREIINQLWYGHELLLFDKAAKTAECVGRAS